MKTTIYIYMNIDKKTHLEQLNLYVYIYVYQYISQFLYHSNKSYILQFLYITKKSQET